MGQRDTFPLKPCALLLVKLTKMGVTRKPDKTSLCSLETHLVNLAAPLSVGV